MSMPKVSNQEFSARASYTIFKIQNKIEKIEEQIESLDCLRKTLAQVCQQRDAECAQIWATYGHVDPDQARALGADVSKIFRSNLKQLGCPELYNKLEKDLPKLETALKLKKEKVATLLAVLNQ